MRHRLKGKRNCPPLELVLCTRWTMKNVKLCLGEQRSTRNAPESTPSSRSQRIAPMRADVTLLHGTVLDFRESPCQPGTTHKLWPRKATNTEQLWTQVQAALGIWRRSCKRLEFCSNTAFPVLSSKSDIYTKMDLNEVVSKPEFHLGYARRAVVNCYRLLYATPRGLFNVCQNLVGISVSDFRRRHNSHLEPGKKNLGTQLLSRWPTWFW